LWRIYEVTILTVSQLVYRSRELSPLSSDGARITKKTGEIAFVILVSEGDPQPSEGKSREY